MSRLLVIMGSGETAPTMVKPHRAIFERVGVGSAVLIDTTYGFQSNADDISARAVAYFTASVGREVRVASWRSADIAGVARERTIAALRGARWLFAGPGSPTYALRQWLGTPVPGIITDLLRTDGSVVVFASAAALTLGSHTIPVYEIYKAGSDPEWTDGLDIIRAVTGLPAVIIPHYDNAEGGHHDTRFCYLGEERLARMEEALPPEAFVLGVDEHTAVVLDLDGRTATVAGNGFMTIRVQGRTIEYPTGAIVTFDAITASVAAANADAASGAPTSGVTASGITGGTGSDGSGAAGTGMSAASRTADLDRVGAGPLAVSQVGAVQTGAAQTGVSRAGAQPRPAPSLRVDEDRIAAGFDAGFDARDVDTCVEAILDLDQALDDWAADTNVSDERDHARATLRQMVVRLGDLARPDPLSPATIGPIMEILIAIRARSRSAKDFATSDAIRDELATLGVEIRDTPTGAIWQRR